VWRTYHRTLERPRDVATDSIGPAVGGTSVCAKPPTACVHGTNYVVSPSHISKPSERGAADSRRQKCSRIARGRNLRRRGKRQKPAVCSSACHCHAAKDGAVLTLTKRDCVHAIAHRTHCRAQEPSAITPLPDPEANTNRPDGGYVVVDKDVKASIGWEQTGHERERQVDQSCCVARSPRWSAVTLQFSPTEQQRLNWGIRNRCIKEVTHLSSLPLRTLACPLTVNWTWFGVARGLAHSNTNVTLPHSWSPVTPVIPVPLRIMSK
jgi:hypothetical protein